MDVSGKQSHVSPQFNITQMFTDKEERVLMERTAAGDRSAFRSLFDVYYPVVHGFMSSILPTREDASDVAQEVFIKLWLMRAALPDITSLRFYLYRGPGRM